MEWFLLGEADDVILSEMSTFGQTAWGRTLRGVPFEVGNADLSCDRRFGDEGTAVWDRDCCLSGEGQCPPHCLLSP